MDNFFDIRKSKLQLFKKQFRKKQIQTEKIDIPSGLFIKCENCNEHLFIEDLVKNDSICYKCDYHFKINASKRISLISDQFQELFNNLITVNPLDFPTYDEKIASYQAKTKQNEAFVCGVAQIKEIEVALGVLDSYFMMGSMGSVVGEKVTRLVEYALINRLPLIIFSASGGARMQEGILSLMQMAKTSGALRYFLDEGLLYISVLTNPTTGGVAASFATLGDIIIAENDALIGFAGPRVIAQTIKEDLPKGFQTAKFQQDKGFVDLIVHRKQMKETLYNLLLLHNQKVTI